MINNNRVVDKFINYVQIPSPSGHESRFIECLVEELKYLACKPYVDNIGNIYVSIPGDDKKAKSILLNAHIDTVAHDGTIKPKIKNRIITSDGKTILGADNKAGVAVIMEVIEQLKEKKISHPDIQVVFTVQEEVGLLGACHIEWNRVYPEYGFVLDGGDVNVIHHRAPSQINLTFEIHGKAAHAGIHPEKGINAVVVASRAISKMKLGRIDSETTANIGIIEGGKATNIIPEKVYVKGEARSHDKKKLDRQVKHMIGVVKQACKGASLRRAQSSRCKVKNEKMYTAFSIKETDPIITRAKNVLRQIKLKPKIQITGGGSDANIFNEKGIKTIIIGVGADNVHTPKERIAIKDLNNSVDYVLKLVKSNA